MRAHAPTARRGVPTSHTRTRLRDRGRSLRLQAAPGSNIYKPLAGELRPRPVPRRGVPGSLVMLRDELSLGPRRVRFEFESWGSPWVLWPRTATNGAGSPRGASRRAPQGSLKAPEFLSRGLRLQIPCYVGQCHRCSGRAPDARPWFSILWGCHSWRASSGHSQYPSGTPVQLPRAETRRRSSNQ